MHDESFYFYSNILFILEVILLEITISVVETITTIIKEVLEAVTQMVGMVGIQGMTKISHL